MFHLLYREERWATFEPNNVSAAMSRVRNVFEQTWVTIKV